MFCAHHDEMHQAIIIAVPAWPNKEYEHIDREKKSFRTCNQKNSLELVVARVSCLRPLCKTTEDEEGKVDSAIHDPPDTAAERHKKQWHQGY